MKTASHGRRILVRVDWNVPVNGSFIDTESLKFRRTLPFLDALSKKGAIVIVMTHLGRPKKRESKLSTKRLASAIQKQEGIPIAHIPDNLETQKGIVNAHAAIDRAAPGDIFLLENVRFHTGEAKNSTSLAKAYASFADLFINDAFASCHRAHASVVGVTKQVPSVAGPSLIREVDALDRLLQKPTRPFFAVIGGAKLSTKIGIIKSLLREADRVYVGGALAHPFYKALGHSIGKSKIERGAVSVATALLKKKNLVLPTDARVATVFTKNARTKNARLDEIERRDTIGDIGVETMKQWARELQDAKTIVWNGPVGAHEYPVFAHGSNLLAHAISRRSATRSVYGVVGGGDTLPILKELGLEAKIDHVSTGGGAMLEFITLNGKLPGLLALQKSKTQSSL